LLKTGEDRANYIEKSAWGSRDKGREQVLKGVSSHAKRQETEKTFARARGGDLGGVEKRE